MFWYNDCMKKYLKNLLAIIGVIFVLGFLFSIIFKPFVIAGNSMFPTVSNGDYVITNRFTNNYERGDIVIFRNPTSKNIEISRIIALPGEEISIERNGVYVDNVLLREPYVSSENIPMGLTNITLPAKNYFVMGDNRMKSSDSRSWGPLNQDYIISKFIRVLLHS